jgi:cytochrome o ubiquinol oxidase subunit 2
MTSRLNLQADRPGVYLGLSAHFSGDGFPGMNFDVNAVPPREFAGWAAAARAAGPMLDEAAYRGLLKQTQDVNPYTYRSVQTGLFAEIVRQELPPGEGPPTARSGADGSTVLAQRHD